jgi:hypothetical protein
MGEEVTADKLAFVAFEPGDGQFVALLSIQGLLTGDKDPEAVLRTAAKVYERSILRMKSLVAEIQAHRARRKLVPARKIWHLGDAIFDLTGQLEELSLQMDRLYDHLVRDLGAKRKWLEKVIIFRRYLPDEALIPESLNWGRCEKGTRKAAERLRDGLPPR